MPGRTTDPRRSVSPRKFLLEWLKLPHVNLTWDIYQFWSKKRSSAHQFVPRDAFFTSWLFILLMLSWTGGSFSLQLPHRLVVPLLQQSGGPGGAPGHEAGQQLVLLRLHLAQLCSQLPLHLSLDLPGKHFSLSREISTVGVRGGGGSGGKITESWSEFRVRHSTAP